MNNCPFCLRESLESRLVLETKNLLVVSDAHPIVNGHLLILSKYHLLSFSSGGIELRREVVETVNVLATKFSVLGSYLIFFEHGNMLENFSGNPSIDHAHIHIIPTNKQLELLFPDNKIKINFLDLDIAVLKISYYFFWEVFSGVSFVGRDCDIGSQFIRKILVSKFDDWNWRNSSDLVDRATENTNFVKLILGEV